MMVGSVLAAAISFFNVTGGGGPGFGVRIGGRFEQRMPCQLELVDSWGAARWSRVPYSSVVQGSGGWTASAVVDVPFAGVSLEVVDSYSVGAHDDADVTVLLTRRVGVGDNNGRRRQHSPAAATPGFSSRFSLGPIPKSAGPAVRIRDRDWLMPGVWYKDSYGVVPPGALAGDPDAATILVREDRLPLPLVMAYDPATGNAAELVHQHPDGATFPGEDSKARLVDARMRFGSIGAVNARDGHSAELVFQYPGSEGDRTYLGGRHRGWANRSHPLTADVNHSYSLRFTLTGNSSGGLVGGGGGGGGSGSGGYVNAVTATWRRAFGEAAPLQRVPDPDLDKVYGVSMDLLATYGAVYDGVPAMPFAVTLPDGVVNDTSSQMGFVGKALPAAALMLLGALEQGGRPDVVATAVAIVDKWVATAMVGTSGQPMTWFNTKPGGTVKYRADSPYMGHLRIASEGMRGVLDAHRTLAESLTGAGAGAASGEERERTRDRLAKWLQFARTYGDFLVSRQAPDGSIAGEWMRNGTEWSNFTNVADHPIPFLIELSAATGDARYRTAAVKAGEFSAGWMMPAFHYIGGACDNPNVLDKEAGALAMHAFLALHGLANESKWLDAAVQAATFVETWVYAWDVPIPAGDPRTVYPASRTTLGVSLIATGQSGADNFAAWAVYDFVKLYKLTSDPHHLEFARFLSAATKQVLDWDGSLGYRYRGLMNEAVTLAVRRGHGVAKWLPWLTCAVLEPMVRMKRDFGSYKIPEVLARA